jgi:thiamine-phosphate pyrophosphorylase
MQIRLVSHFDSVKQEHELLLKVFEHADVLFHLRKRNFSDLDMLNYLNEIPQEYHHRIIMHSHFHFANSFDFHGFHFNKQYDLAQLKKDIDDATFEDIQNKIKGFSVHNLNDILALKNEFDYVLISPVFDSISNRGYNSKIKIKTFQKFLEQQADRVPVIAMGGIKTENIPLAFTAGFDGVALLGHIWNYLLESGNITKTYALFEGVVHQVEQLMKTRVLVGE